MSEECIQVFNRLIADGWRLKDITDAGELKPFRVYDKIPQIPADALQGLLRAEYALQERISPGVYKDLVQALVRKAHAAGIGDTEIGKILNVTPQTPLSWRKGKGPGRNAQQIYQQLKPLREQLGEDDEIDDRYHKITRAQMREKINDWRSKGYTDSEIAAKLGVTVARIKTAMIRYKPTH